MQNTQILGHSAFYKQINIKLVHSLHEVQNSWRNYTRTGSTT